MKQIARRERYKKGGLLSAEQQEETKRQEVLLWNWVTKVVL